MGDHSRTIRYGYPRPRRMVRPTLDHIHATGSRTWNPHLDKLLGIRVNSAKLHGIRVELANDLELELSWPNYLALELSLP